MTSPSQPPVMAEDSAGEKSGPGEEVKGFLPAAFFGETPPQVGQKCSVTVTAVDPDTGEAEVTYDDESADQEGGAMDAMDKQFPQEPEE